MTKRHGKLTVIEHLGSAHNPVQLAALEEAGQEKINESTGQLALDLDSGSDVSTTSRRRAAVIICGSLFQYCPQFKRAHCPKSLGRPTIHTAYNRLGFDVIDDEAFFQLFLARLVEPISKSDSVRVLDELGADTKHRSTFTRYLQRANADSYRETIAAKCFDYSLAATGISLILYDVTTLLCRRRHKKGYVTNIEAKVMTAREVVGSYHDLWHVEQSFRMSKTDLRARPIFRRTRDAIEAHLPVVFTALAVARFMQVATGLSLKKIITTLRPLREFVGEIDGHKLVFPPEVPPSAAELVSNVENYGAGPDAKVKQLWSVFPGLSSRTVLETWAGLRPCIADGLPAVGRTCDPGLSVATGHGQQGLVLAPITSAIVHAQMQGQPGTPSGVDPHAISPERFRSS